MRKITTAIVILMLIFVVRSNAQDKEHIQNIIIKYQVSLSDLESKIETLNIDSLTKKNNLKLVILSLKKLQNQKFNIDSAFIEYEFLNKRILLDEILKKKRPKRKNKKELQKELLKWNYNSCHPKSDRLWHSVSKFFYHLETLSNSTYIQENTFVNLLKKVKQQQIITSIILEDI